MSVRDLALYFLRLGALGFGGPVALANAMRRDLVDERGWLTADEFDEGLALSAACPGPLAYQLAVYCGYIRFGFTGGLAVAFTFALPPFLIVVAAAALYRTFENAHALRALFYGVAPAIVAIIAKACWNLGRKTLKNDVRAWAFAAIACAIVVAVERELAWLFIGAGVIGLFVFARPKRAVAMSITPELFLFFFKTGLLVFGSGLVIVPFLKTQVVDQYHWLTMQQFLDSVAIGMISPGPVVITATFVGYLLAGWAGAIAATLGIFSPPVLFVLAATPLLRRYRASRWIQAFIRGVSTAVVGVLVATTWLIARTAVVDPWTFTIAALALAVTAFTRVPDPAVIAAAALVGLVVR
ncbi:MAG TPA: chromate transporter [Thermoanaerobaculia bacterium]|nr:chromate transporter [Thermoanaerobaculia bacterium]